MVIWRTLLAGGIAGVVSRTLTSPLERIKILAQVSSACTGLIHAYLLKLNFQTGASGKLSVLQSFKNVWRTERFNGLFVGNGANCLRIFPFSGLVCLAYANMAKVGILFHML